MDTKARIKQFILDEILGESNSTIKDFADDENLTDSGILDSLGMLRLVAFLDDELNTDIMSQAISLDDFATLDKICSRLSNSENTAENENDAEPVVLDEHSAVDSDYVEIADRDVFQSEGASTVDLGLAGKVVVVTGSSRGLGATIAQLFASCGSQVVINYRNNRSAADTVCEHIVSSGGSAMVVRADVSDPGQVIHMMHAVSERWGGVDILVNNAIQSFDTEILQKLEWPDVQASIDVVVRGAFNCCKSVVPGMLQRGSGKIVNIGTLATDNPAPNTLAYVLAKSALVGLTRSLAVDYAANNIQVNMVCPGLVETDLVSHIPQSFRKKIASETPMRRNATVVDVAQAVIYLASNQSNFMTGQKLMVTGGQAPFH